MTKPKRTNIPSKISDEVEFLSGYQCCICLTPKRADHIHHIDGNNSNHNIDNLAFLCFEHHNEASTKGSLSRKLSPGGIKRCRAAHYKKIKAQREFHLPQNHPITKVTESDLLTAALNANIILEIDKIKFDYLYNKSADKSDVLNRLDLYSPYNNLTISTHVFDFLVEVAQQTRMEKSKNTVWAIYTYMLEFFPPQDLKQKRKETDELGRTIAYIGFCVAYDGAIHCRNLTIFAEGLEILKYIYSRAVSNKLPSIKKEVLSQFSSLYDTLRRPERSDLGNAQIILDAFVERLDTPGAIIGELPYALFKLIHPEIDR